MEKLELDALGMSKQRILLIQAVIVLLIVGSLFNIVIDRETWPFSQYPMFSGVQREYSLSGLQLFGLTREEPYYEVPLRDAAYIHPFDRGRLKEALRRMGKGEPKQRRQQLLEDALFDSLERYERLRLAGRHDGPPLRGVRLYRLQWRLDARAENADQPNHRELVAEVERP